MLTKLLSSRLLKMRIECFLSIIIVFALFLPFSAWCVDVLPAAYTPAPAGINVAYLFYTHTERNKQYVNGNQLPIDARLDSDVGQVRYARYMDVAGVRILPIISLPFGTQNGKYDSSALGNTGGLGDLILATTIWLINNPEKNTFFGITPYLFLPTGDYDKSKSLNMGENCWKAAAQVGLNTGLTDKVRFDLIGDVTFYGDNSQFGPNGVTMKQDLSFQIQTYARYKFTPSLESSLGFSYVLGGEREVNGVKKNDALSTSKFILGGAYNFRPSTMLVITYGRDISVENGFMESNKILLRLTEAF
ncbi:MAG: transporter [Deltaproteobacteria bacterium]